MDGEQMNSEPLRILVERIYQVINQEMWRIETMGPEIIKFLIEEKENKCSVKLANNDKVKESKIKEVLHKTRNLQVKLSNISGYIKEMRGPGIGIEEVSTLTELENTERIVKEWKMEEYDVIHGRRMDDEPWCICSMTIIKRRLSELIVNANNLMKAADGHMNDIMCYSDMEAREKYKQTMNLLSITWQDFKDGPFLPEEDIKWSPETICKYSLQRRLEFVLWMVVSNTLNIRMRLKMYNDVLSELSVKTENKGVINMVHDATSNTSVQKDIVSMDRHNRLKMSTGSNVNRNRRYKTMSKTDSVGNGNELEGECKNKTIHRKNSVRKQKEKAIRKITSMKHSLKAYSYIS